MGTKTAEQSRGPGTTDVRENLEVALSEVNIEQPDVVGESSLVVSWPRLSAAHSLDPILDTTRVLIGIPAYNEELNIGRTLDFLARKYPQYSIVVVSGSTDGTNRVTRELMRRHANIDLIVERERCGKSSALSILLRNLYGRYDALICLGADNIPEDDAIDKLLSKLSSDPRIGLVGGRPIPVNNPTKLAGWMTHLLWSVHHAVSIDAPKISGELFALRAGVVSEIPPTIINDDAYLQFVVAFRGYELSYEPEAVVYLRGPEKVKEYYNQRHRVTIGHYQVEQLLGAKLPTTYARRNVLLAWRERRRVGFVKECCGFLFFLALSAVIVAKAWFDFYIRRNLPYKWRQVRGTKKI